MTQQSEFVMHVEYCKSCPTHSWCTHHDQQKYQSIYIKLKKFINEEFPDIKIYGNRVPDQLVAIKPAQNKYFNTRTNKYVTFPIIGAFQITLNNQKLFSKKQDNCWPNFNQIKDQVYFKVNGKKRTIIQQPQADVDRDITTANNFSVNHSFLDNADKRTTFHKSKNNKNFTLTDHFKTYKVQNKENKSEIPTDNQKSQNMTSMNSLKNQIQFAQFKRNFEEYGLKNNNVPQFIKKKAFFRDEYGKKEMIVKLDSIQQESILFQQAQKAKRTSFKNSTKKTINPYNNLDSELDELQSKFRNFQQRVQHIRRKNKEFDSIPKINENVMKQYKSLQKQKQKYHRNNNKLSQNKFQKNFNDNHHEQDEEDYLTNPIIFAKKRLNNIQEYINGTEQQKNQKLKKIYGEWKLLKKPTKYKKFKYVSPYRIQNQKTKHNKDIKVQDGDEDSSDEQLTTHVRNNHSNSNSKNNYKLQKLPPVNSKTKKEVKQNHFLSNRQNFNLKTKNKTQQDFFNSKSKFKGKNQIQLDSHDEEKVQNKFSRNYFRNSKAKLNTFQQNKDLNSQFSSKQISDKQNEGFVTKNGFFQSQQNFTKKNQNQEVQHFKRGRKFSKQKSKQFSRQNSNQLNSIEKQKTFNTHNSVHSANTKIKMPSVHKPKNKMKQNGVQKGINNFIQQKKTSNHDRKLNKINKQKRDELKKKQLRNSRQQQESNQSLQQNQRGWSVESDQKQQICQQQIYNRKASPRQQSLNTQKTKKMKNAKEMLLDIKQQKDKETKTKRKYKSNGSQNSVLQDQNSDKVDKKHRHYKNDQILSSESEQQQQIVKQSSQQYKKEKKSLVNNKNIDTVNKSTTKQKTSSPSKKEKTKRSKKQSSQKKLSKSSSKVSQQQKLSEEEEKNHNSVQKEKKSSNERKNKDYKEVKKKKKQNIEKNSQIQNSLHTSQKQEQRSCEKPKLKGKNHLVSQVHQDSDDVSKKDQIIKIAKNSSYHSDAKSHNSNMQEKSKAKKSNKTKKSNQKNKKSPKQFDLVNVNVNESEEDGQKIVNKNNQQIDSSTKNNKMNVKNQSKSSKKKKIQNKQKEQSQSYQVNGSDKSEGQIQDNDAKVLNKKRQLEQKNNNNNNSYLSQLSNSNSKVFDNNENNTNKISVKNSKLSKQKDSKINSSPLNNSNSNSNTDNQDNQDKEQYQKLKQKNKASKQKMSKSSSKSKSNFNKNDCVIQNQSNKHQDQDQSQLEQSGVTSLKNKKNKSQAIKKVQKSNSNSNKISKVQNQVIDQANQKSIFHQIKHNKEWKQAQKIQKIKKNKAKKGKANQINNKSQQQQDQLQNDSQEKSIESADQKSNSNLSSQQQQSEEQVQMSSQSQRLQETQTENEPQNEQNQKVKNLQDVESSEQAQIKYKDKVKVKSSKKKRDINIIQSRQNNNENENKYSTTIQRDFNKSEKSQSKVKQKNMKESNVNVNANVKSEGEIQPKNINQSDASQQCQDQNKVNSQALIKESQTKIPVLNKESETDQQINQNNQIDDKEILENKEQENKVDKINLNQNNQCMIERSKTVNNSKRSQSGAKSKRIKVFADKDSQDEPQDQQQKQQSRGESREKSHQNQKSSQNNKIKSSSQQMLQSKDENSKLLEQRQEIKDNNNVYAEAKQKNKQKNEKNNQPSHNTQMIDFGVQMDALVNQSMQTSNIYLEKQSSNLYSPMIKPHETSQNAVKQKQQSNEKIKANNYPAQTSSTFGNQKLKASQILNEQNVNEKLKTDTLKEDQILDNSYTFQDKKQQLNRNQANRSKLIDSLQNVRSSRIQNTQFIRNSQQKSAFLPNSHQDLKNNKTLTSNISSRAHIIRQLYGQNVQQQIKKFSNFMKLSNEKKAQFQKTEQQVSINKKISISKIFGQNLVLFDQRSIQPEYVEFNCLIPQFFKLIKILTNINEFLIVRLFQNPKLMNQNYYGVWLCVESEWRCVIVDDQIQVNQKTNKPIYHYHSNNQVWPMILQKALAKTLGGYNNLIKTPCHKLFTMLTGSNSLFFNIKEDPTKNSKILKYISDCENKNFVIHAEKICKNLQEYQRKQKEVRIYYVLSEKKVNENQSLIEVRQDNKNSLWIKLSKFVQEFKSIQILQLRINHNFCQINLPKSTSTNHLTIVQLDFFQQSFGSITVTAPTPTALKTYLYKEEKSNILKLIGEAKQKNKINLFFDCYFMDAKYYLFVQTKLECKVAYFGQNKPFMKVIQEINSQGLKNDYTEYLPIKSMNKQNKQKMPKTINKAKFGDTGMSFKSQQDKISRLRQNFVQYLLKSRQNQQ